MSTILVNKVKPYSTDPDAPIFGGTVTLESPNITLQGTVAASSHVNVQGNLNLSGSGVPTIESDNNLLLSASNGSVIVKDKLNLYPTGTGSVSSPSNGDMVYDTVDHKFYGYANGSWVAFH